MTTTVNKKIVNFIQKEFFKESFQVLQLDQPCKGCEKGGLLTGNDCVTQGGRSYTSANGRAVGSDYDRLGAVQELVKHSPVAGGQ